MPPLRKMKNPKTLPVPQTTAEIAAATDVLVVGGDPAGIGAALGAAAAGAKVILTEHYGFLGGNITAGLMMPLMSFFTRNKSNRKPSGLLVPKDQGVGEPVIGGVTPAIIERMAELGGAVRPGFETGYLTPIDADIMKIVAFDMMDEAGVDYLLHAQALHICWEDDLKTVFFHTKSGPIGIQAKVVVDCTGDGDVAVLAGADYKLGRPEDGLTAPMSIMFRLGGFEPAGFERYVNENPDQWNGIGGLEKLVKQATNNGELHLEVDKIMLFQTPHPTEVVVDATRVTRVHGTNVFDLTYAERENHRQMKEIYLFLRKYVPGFEHCYITESGVSPQIRETRRIMGEYELTEEDILGARKFEDAIARSAYPIDIHEPDGKGLIVKQLPEGETYDIPLRCLIPKHVDSLVVAGRCMSGTHAAESSYRIESICFATGQAAGVCAALAVKTGAAPRSVPASKVQEELLRQGAILGKIPQTKTA